jgi:uroporphyrinogen III methyltransferase/synthase
VREGKVDIVGAGPGDPGLITVKGLDRLAQADAIIYDQLVDRRLLDFARADAELVFAGKSSKCHAKEQDEINRLLVERAREGKSVVRLKGSDPFVLGRGGEEAEALAREGIPFEVVPGVSSSTAVPAYAGIPVTHRNIASSFAVITGHEDPTKDRSSINWDKLATGVDTIVVLMGMGNLTGIAAKLMEHGRAPETPVALVRHGTTARQRTITGTLATIAGQAQRDGFQPPVVIVVGEVVRLRDTLAWFDNQPLFGKRVLVTRARRQASALSRLLADRGAEPVELPVIEVKDVPDPAALDRSILELHSFDWVIFTSANAVKATWRRVRALGLDARAFAGARLGAIGPATAQVLMQRGLKPDFVPESYTSRGMLSGLEAIGVEGCRILLPRASIAPAELAEGLVELGAVPFEVTAYVTELPPEAASRVSELLGEGPLDIVTFTSSSTVSNLLALLGEEGDVISQARIACIGPVTAATAENAGLRPDIVAAEQTVPGLVRAIEDYFREAEAR